VLDRPEQSRFSLREMELLGMFANQAAIALSLLSSARRARAALDGAGDAAVVAQLASVLDSLEGERRESATALLRDLARVLGA
jgi:GAF domain-containing protein